MSNCYVGGLLIESSTLPLLKHACEEAIGCHTGCQEVGRCYTRAESQGMYITYASTRVPKQGYQWPHKKDLCPPIFFKKVAKIKKISI